MTTPTITGIAHFSPTVTDVEASADWYQRVFSMDRVPVTFPHHGDESGGHAVLLMQPETGVVIGLHHHAKNAGEQADESRTGLDHIAFHVPDHAALSGWTTHLEALGVEHSGVIDVQGAMPYSVVVFRDPDNIQLELFHMSAQ